MHFERKRIFGNGVYKILNVGVPIGRQVEIRVTQKMAVEQRHVQQTRNSIGTHLTITFRYQIP